MELLLLVAFMGIALTFTIVGMATKSLAFLAIAGTFFFLIGYGVVVDGVEMPIGETSTTWSTYDNITNTTTTHTNTTTQYADTGTFNTTFLLLLLFLAGLASFIYGVVWTNYNY